jgi:hypothetical protein
VATRALSEIAITLRLSRDAEAKLGRRAAAAGQPLAEYVATLVESVVETRMRAPGGPSAPLR